MARLREALLLPVVVFPSAAVVAIAIAWILHQVSRELAPAVALLFTVLITAAGFFFSSRGDGT